MYWLEHFLLLLIPILLLKTYTVPKYTTSEMFAWAMIAYGVWGLFHFWFLLPIALFTQANLNSVLCPAITDPFRLSFKMQMFLRENSFFILFENILEGQTIYSTPFGINLFQPSYSG